VRAHSISDPFDSDSAPAAGEEAPKAEDGAIRRATPAPKPRKAAPSDPTEAPARKATKKSVDPFEDDSQ
jgi:hypothetical protein